MYYVIPSYVFDDAKLSRSDILVYAILSHAADDGHSAPTVLGMTDEMLANLAGIGKRTVQSCLSRMEMRGYLKRKTSRHTHRKIYITHPATKI